MTEQSKTHWSNVGCSKAFSWSRGYTSISMGTSSILCFGEWQQGFSVHLFGTMESDRSSPLSPSNWDVSQETAYIPIRVLGRGAFGQAVLYRKVEDNSLVVWKEVELGRLSPKERRDSQHEIDILSLLNHANIVCYYNHFLDGDTLLIEMEYANGGNLHEKIAEQQQLFAEDTVLWYFYQCMAAIVHIHEYSILHRDIKALNIFLTKSGLIKLGDFGISKVLDYTSQMADSYVGTPYYMSPELIKGDQYNQKSDVWAAGCVLFELLTLSKVFDATNPLKLASDIVRADVAGVSPVYSEGLQHLVRDMLCKDASKRPSAEEAIKYPVLNDKAKEFETKVWTLNSASRKLRMSVSGSGAEVMPVVTAQSSEVYCWGGGKMVPQHLEVFTKGKSAIQVAAGHSHFAVVTVEKELYTWANAQGPTAMVGQLGHGDTASYKAPKRVEAFDKVAIKQVSCGEDFTVCCTEDGNVYSFGSHYYGCLGADTEDSDSVCTPVLVDFFSSRPVQQISCGEQHVVALTREGEVYTWGSGEFGRLGLGTEDDHASPQKVETRGRHGIQSVHAGPDCTFLIKTNGRVLVCGSNEHNKLGLNSCAKGLRKKQVSYDIPCIYSFTTVKPLIKYNIVAVSAGQTHSAAIDFFGHLITFGSNKYGQLGLSDLRERSGVNLIAGCLAGKRIIKVGCGDCFTVAATSDNLIYSWGLSENGRLGCGSGEGKGPGSSCFSLPRTIFGSLHVFADVNCRHWNTILVADKVLAQKTIRSANQTALSSKQDYSVQPDSVFSSVSEEDEGSYDGGSCATAETDVVRSPSGESSVPSWLQAELADAEFIPASGVDEAHQVCSGDVQTAIIHNTSTPRDSSLKKIGEDNIDLEEALKLILTLKEKMSGLESENEELKNTVSQQSETIKSQAEIINKLEEKVSGMEPA